jgi:hypothetical protein
MALLRKIHSATLIEALVATVLIIVTFVVASMVLNNLLLNSISNNTHQVQNRLFELEYLSRNKVIALPYKEDFDQWNIEISTVDDEGKTWNISTATNKDNNKTIISKRLCKLK